MLAQAGIVHRRHRLNATVQVAGHPVGAAQEHLGLAAIGEPEQPRVFQEAADHAHHPNVVAGALQARPQAAHAAHHQLDAHPRLGGLVEQGDDRRIHQGIHLGPQMAAPAGSRLLNLPPDQRLHAGAQRHRSHQQPPEGLLFGKTGEVIE